jgi:hypothetical protein
MGFLTYKKTVTGGRAAYERLNSLKLGGREGLIARHVKTLSEDQCRSWKLEPAALLQLAGAGAAGGNLVVLFDVAGPEAASVCLYELGKIHGSCRDNSTQLALDFAVVVDQEIDGDAAAYARKFEVAVPERPRRLGETLSLSGGSGGGDWKWGAPPMQLGATIINGAHGHGGGEPCPNCTCGRRAALA